MECRWCKFVVLENSVKHTSLVLDQQTEDSGKLQLQNTVTEAEFHSHKITQCFCRKSYAHYAEQNVDDANLVFILFVFVIILLLIAVGCCILENETSRPEMCITESQKSSDTKSGQPR